MFCRDKEDASITIADKRRDYMQRLDNRLVVGGEDKPKRELMRKAVQELLDKHKGANPAVYGDLGYLILFATAADAVSVFALNLCQNARLEPLIPEFVVRHATTTEHAYLNNNMFCLIASKVCFVELQVTRLCKTKCLTRSQVTNADGGLGGSSACGQVVYQPGPMA